MNCFCVREFETAVIRELGYCSAIHSDSEPQPQPSSRMRSPSASLARSQVSESMRASASSSVDSPAPKNPQEYFRCRPSTSSKNSQGNS